MVYGPVYESHTTSRRYYVPEVKLYSHIRESTCPLQEKRSKYCMIEV